MAHDHRSFALPAPLRSSAAPRRRSEWRALGMLLPYLWEFRFRVGIALAFLIGAKLANVGVPAAILLGTFDWRCAAVTFAAVAVYIAFTVTITEWRMEIRRRANELDSRANTRAIDSLLNYETVKYFNNEEYEARRYDDNLQSYESAAVKNEALLGLLNIGQSLIIAVAVTALMVLAAEGVVAKAR